MIKKRHYVLALLAVGALNGTVFADEVCKMKGSTLSCGAGQLESILNVGSISLQGTTVAGSTDESGSFKAKNAHLVDVSIAGTTELTQSEVSGLLQITGTTKFTSNQFLQPVKVTGHLTSEMDNFAQSVQVAGQIDAQGSVFSGDLRTSSNEISLSHVEANNIEVLPGSSTHKQSLYLRDEAMIHGNINFTGGKGLVFITSGAQVEGEITGAEVFHGDLANQ